MCHDLKVTSYLATKPLSPLLIVHSTLHSFVHINVLHMLLCVPKQKKNKEKEKNEL